MILPRQAMMELFGSKFGNANSHNARKLPILLGGHTACDADKNTLRCIPVSRCSSSWTREPTPSDPAPVSLAD